MPALQCLSNDLGRQEGSVVFLRRRQSPLHLRDEVRKGLWFPGVVFRSSKKPP